MGPPLILLFFVPFVVVRVGASANVTVHPMNTLLAAIVSGGSAGSVLTQPFWRVFLGGQLWKEKGVYFLLALGVILLLSGELKVDEISVLGELFSFSFNFYLSRA